jgi:hypothetical protein
MNGIIRVDIKAVFFNVSRHVCTLNVFWKLFITSKRCLCPKKILFTGISIASSEKKMNGIIERGVVFFGYWVETFVLKIPTNLSAYQIIY